MLDLSEKYHIYKTALATWGKKSQTILFMEESSKLTTELAKSLRGDKCDVVDKIASVEIALEILVSMLDCQSSVSEQKRQKLIKMRERVKNA